MTVAEMRRKLENLYGPDWNARVQKMGDKQVVAVYTRLKHQNKI